jgi:hypothetical protein
VAVAVVDPMLRVLVLVDHLLAVLVAVTQQAQQQQRTLLRVAVEVEVHQEQVVLAVAVFCSLGSKYEHLLRTSH